MEISSLKNQIHKLASYMKRKNLALPKWLNIEGVGKGVPPGVREKEDKIEM